MSCESTFAEWPRVMSDVVAGHSLSGDVAQEVMASMLSGQATDAQIGGFLAAMAAKGETTEELLGFREAMFDVSTPLELPPEAVDIVGVGGAPRRRVSAFNVSTIASIVAAAAGGTVCKHGNRKASSTSGSFDLLEALGVNIECDAERIAEGVATLGLGYAFARAHHPAMRHVGPARAQLGVPTMFNVLGPLAHPGRVRRQVLGVPDARRASQIADVVAEADSECVWVVHGHEDLDELTISGPSDVIEIRGTQRRSFTIDPQDFGVAPVASADVIGGDAAVNAELTQDLLAGTASPNRDIVVLNAAAGLVVGGQCDDLGSGIQLASNAIDDGSAAAKLAALVAHTNG